MECCKGALQTCLVRFVCASLFHVLIVFYVIVSSWLFLQGDAANLFSMAPYRDQAHTVHMMSRDAVTSRDARFSTVCPESVFFGPSRNPAKRCQERACEAGRAARKQLISLYGLETYSFFVWLGTANSSLYTAWKR